MTNASLSHPLIWRASDGVRLTLNQLGLDDLQISSLAESFTESGIETTDRAFLQFAYAQGVANRGGRVGRPGAPSISLGWGPSRTLSERLMHAGYWKLLIRYALDEFIVAVRDSTYRPISYEAAFTQYLTAKWPLAKLSHGHWEPGAASGRFLGYSGLRPGQVREALVLFRETPAGAAASNIPSPDRHFCEFALRWNELPDELS